MHIYTILIQTYVKISLNYTHKYPLLEFAHTHLKYAQRTPSHINFKEN